MLPAVVACKIRAREEDFKSKRQAKATTLENGETAWLLISHILIEIKKSVR